MGFFGDKHELRGGVGELRPVILGAMSVCFLFAAFVQTQAEMPQPAPGAVLALARLAFRDAPLRWLMLRYLDVELVARAEPPAALKAAAATA